MTTDTTASLPDRRIPPSESLDDILDDLIGLSAAAKLIPPTRGGKRVHVATLTRWVVDGVSARHPERESGRIYLRAVRSPGQWMTTREWVAEFIAALTADRNSQHPASGAAPQCTPARRRREAERVERELDQLGI